MLFYCTVCLSIFYTINYLYIFPVLRKYRLHKNTYQCKFSIVPEEGWFGQPKYSTPSKKSSYVVSVFAFLKTIPFGAAHTYISYIGEYPPPRGFQTKQWAQKMFADINLPGTPLYCLMSIKKGSSLVLDCRKWRHVQGKNWVKIISIK